MLNKSLLNAFGLFLLICVSYRANLWASDMQTAYVWDFEAEYTDTERDSDLKYLSEKLTDEFEEKLIQARCFKILDRRSRDLVIFQEKLEQKIRGIEDIPEEGKDILKEKQADFVIFGIIFDDIKSGEYKIRVTIETFQGEKIALESIRLRRGKIFDAEHRELSMEELSQLLCEAGIRHFQKYQVGASQQSTDISIHDLEARLIDSWQREQFYREQLATLTETLNALAKLQTESDDFAQQISDAKKQLEQGDSEKVKVIFAQLLEEKMAQAHAVTQEAAAVARQLGALHFLSDTEEALTAYRRAVQLDPENPTGWNQLGRLLLRIKDLENAQEAFEKVLEWANLNDDGDFRAKAYNNLGAIHFKNHNLQEAAAMFQKSLAINEVLSNEEGIATQYGNIANIHCLNNELEQAEENYLRSLEIFVRLDNKIGMAMNYNNLGVLYIMQSHQENSSPSSPAAGTVGLIRHDGPDISANETLTDNLERAESMFNKSLKIFKEIGSEEGITQQYSNLYLLKTNPRTKDVEVEKLNIHTVDAIILDEDIVDLIAKDPSGSQITSLNIVSLHAFGRLNIGNSAVAIGGVTAMDSEVSSVNVLSLNEIRAIISTDENIRSFSGINITGSEIPNIKVLDLKTVGNVTVNNSFVPIAGVAVSDALINPVNILSLNTVSSIHSISSIPSIHSSVIIGGLTIR